MNATTGEVLRGFVPSIEQASQVLQISRNMANRYLQSVDGFYSNVFHCTVTLALVGSTLIQKKIQHRRMEKDVYSTLQLPGGALTLLNGHLVWIFLQDKISYYGPFLSFTEASKFLNPLKHKDPISSHSNLSKPIKRNCNLENLVNTEKGKVYVACNPKAMPYPSNPKGKASPLYGKLLPMKPFSK